MRRPGENLESPFIDQEILPRESESMPASSDREAGFGPGTGIVLEYEVVTEPEHEQREAAGDAAKNPEYELVIDSGPPAEPEAEEESESEEDASETYEESEASEPEKDAGDEVGEGADQEFDEEPEAIEEDMVRFRSKEEMARYGDPRIAREEEEDFTPEFEDQLGVDKGVFTAQAKDRFILLVSGYNYQEQNDGYDELARNRARVIVSKAKFKSDNSLVFVWFSVAAGKVFINRRTNGVWKLNNTADWTPIDEFKFDATHSQLFNFEAIEVVKHYGMGGVFKQNVANTVISIINVYDFILKLGRHKSATLMEFSIISHGFWRGPILVNSIDASNHPTNRDASDKDGRGNKDFLVANIDTAAIHDAFHPDGFSWIWSCIIAYGPYAVIQGVADSKLKKTVWGRQVKALTGAGYKPDGTTPGTAKFRFSFGKAKTEEFSRLWDPVFFPTGVESFDRTFSEIKEFVKKLSEETYYYALTLASDKPCYGPPLGTSTNYSTRDPYRPGVPVVHWVERGARRPAPEKGFEGNYNPVITFFVRTMKMPEDPEKRGYVRYALWGA